MEWNKESIKDKVELLKFDAAENYFKSPPKYYSEMLNDLNKELERVTKIELAKIVPIKNDITTEELMLEIQKLISEGYKIIHNAKWKGPIRMDNELSWKYVLEPIEVKFVREV